MHSRKANLTVPRILPLQRYKYFIAIFCCIVLQAMNTLHAQDRGWLVVRVHDRVTGLRLAEATVSYGRSKTVYPVNANGEVIMSLIDGDYPFTIKCPGYQTRRLSKVQVMEGVQSGMDVFLVPMASPDSDQGKDSELPGDSMRRASPESARSDAYRLYLEEPLAQQNIIQQADIGEETDRDLSWVVRRQGGGFVSSGLHASAGDGLVMSAMGERYNQVMLNGVPIPAVGAIGRRFLLAAYPADAVDYVKHRSGGHTAVPADITGGMVEVRLKAIPVQNYVIAQGGLSLVQQQGEQEIQRSPWSTGQWIGLPGGFRKLPVTFPQTRSRTALSDVNIQEKADLLGELPNGMESSVAQPSIGGSRFLFGIGRRYLSSKGIEWGFTTSVLYQLSTASRRSSVAVGPNIKDNPFPFGNSGGALISAFSTDEASETSRSMSVAFGTGVIFKKNIVRLHIQAGSLLDETVTDRQGIFKPDEDTLANFARMYQASQLGFIATQISGEHAFGRTSSLQMDWQVGYTYQQPEKPDERHLLFRRNPGNAELTLVTPAVTPLPDRNNVGNVTLAANLNAIFPNSYRSWETTKDHHFVARAGLQFPFRLWNSSHMLRGGMLLQTHYREHYTDRLMYWDGRANLPGALLEAGQFFPGGVQAEEYYTKAISGSGFFQISDLQEDNLGNYTGSLNNGASYLQYSGYPVRNLALDLGVRVESSSQLVSSTEYSYFEAFRNYRLTTLNENATVSRFDLLPAVRLRFEPARGLIMHAGYIETVNRPQMQELSAYRYYDPGTFTVFKGNPFLESTKVRNITVGADWRFHAGTVLSVEAFQRRIDQPIEQVVSRFAGMRGVFFVTPHNMPQARVNGVKADIELPFSRRSRSVWSFVSVQAGGVLSNSEVDAGPLRSGLTPVVPTHRLSGTPDYTAHAGLVIRHPDGFGFSAVYQAIGNRLFAVGSGGTVQENGADAVLLIPHYQEKERSEVNVQASYGFFRRRMSVIVGAENLFRTPYILYQDLNGDGKMGSPLVIEPTTAGGNYVSGEDNVVRRVDQTPRIYFRLSCMF